MNKSIRMFVYLNKTKLTKTVARLFDVKKITNFKVKEMNPGRVKGIGYICGSYNKDKRIIYLNSEIWSMLTEYEQYELFTHELIHVYQHEYDLCPFDYSIEYEKRPQELHAERYAEKILKLLNIVETDISIFEYGKEITER